MNGLNNLIMVLIGLVIVVASAGWLITSALWDLRNAIIALVSLSTKKGTLPPADWTKIVPKGTRDASAPYSTHIHFPKSMFPNE